MATTTNFGWETPDDTDLVKDGALAMRTLGNSIDTSFVDLKGGTTGQNLRKASNTDLDFTWAGDATNTVIDAAGDLLYGSAADTLTRLPLGTAGQVLKVNSGATAPEWGAAGGASAMTKIAGTTFTTQSSVAIDSVFSSTYRRYMAVLSVTSSVQNAVLQMQYRYAGPTTQTADYYGSFWRIDRNNAGTGAGYANVAQMTLDTHLNSSGGTQFPLTVWFSNVGDSSTSALIYGQGQTSISQSATLFAGYVDTARTYTGFLIKPDSGTITGSYAVYGLEN